MVGPVVFPLAKLGVLVVKQISKPLARRIAARAKTNEVFKDWACVPIAQLFHFYEVKIKMNALNLGTSGKVTKLTKVPRLSEGKAVEQGSEILSELIILIIAIGVLVYEYRKIKEEKREEEALLKSDREFIKKSIYKLEVQVEEHNNQIRDLIKTAVRHQEKIHKNTQPGGDLTVLKDSLDEIPEDPKEVKPLVLLEDEEEAKDSKRTEIKNTRKNSIKPLSEEFVEFVEEVVEELLDAVNPDDDD